MLSGKKLAQIVRPSRKLYIEKTDNHYFLTDTYILVKLTEAEFEEFFAKYNSYKSTANIPFDFSDNQGICSTDGNQFLEDNLDVSFILNQLEEVNYEVELTNFYKQVDDRLARIYKLGDQLSMINDKYQFLLDVGDVLKTEEKTRPLFVLKDEKFKAAIMPIRDTDQPLSESISELIMDKSLKEVS
ncbi:hypothetical protein JCM16358_11560 [Halanaerocella petrolearia]